MSMSNFPNEIIDCIFQMLDSRTLYQCIFVCKQWQSLASRIFYQEVNLSRGNIQTLKRNVFSSIEENQGQHFIYGGYARKLKIQYDNNTVLTRSQFSSLLYSLPNLKTIDISESTFRNKYLYMLLDEDHNISNSVEEILPSSVSGHFPTYHVDSIHRHQIYFKICSKLCQTITHLTLFYQHNMINAPGSLYIFTSLTHLTICNQEDPSLSIFQILDWCPYLISFEFSSSLPVPDEAEILLNDMIENNGGNLSSCGKNLQVLKISVPSFTRPYIRYLTSYASSKLEKICISMSEVSFYNWTKTHGKVTALELAKRIGRSKSSSLSTPFDSWPANDYDVALVCDIFWRVLYAMSGDRGLICYRSPSNRTKIDIRDNGYLYYNNSYDRSFSNARHV